MAQDPRFSPAAGGSGGERSASSWLGCGCAGIVAVFMAGVVLVTFLTWRAGKQLGEMTQNPEQAAAAVAEVLPHEELPEGYQPYGTLSIPFVMKVAFLGGPGHPARPGEGETFEHAFLFIRVRDWFGRGERARGWLESGEGDRAPIEQEEIQFQPEEVVDRGELTVDGAAVSWVARRGTVRVDASRFEEGGGEEDGGNFNVRVEGDEGADVVIGSDQGEPQESVLTLMSIRCADDDGWERMGIWFAPDPAPRAPVEAADWTGTPADPQAVASFLGHFELCTG